MPLPSPGVQFRGIRLHALDFEITGSAPDTPPSDVPIEFEVATGDTHPRNLVVWFRCTVFVEGWFRTSVNYQMTFLRDNAEMSWNTIVARLTPLVLYPYCRETISGLFLKAAIPTNPPPIIDFGRLFNPDEMGIPEPQPEQADAAAAPTQAK